MRSQILHSLINHYIRSWEVIEAVYMRIVRFLQITLRKSKEGVFLFFFFKKIYGEMTDCIAIAIEKEMKQPLQERGFKST